MSRRIMEYTLALGFGLTGIFENGFVLLVGPAKKYLSSPKTQIPVEALQFGCEKRKKHHHLCTHNTESSTRNKVDPTAIDSSRISFLRETHRICH